MSRSFKTCPSDLSDLPVVVERSLLPVVSDNLLRRNRGFFFYHEAQSLEIETFHLSDENVRI